MPIWIFFILVFLLVGVDYRGVFPFMFLLAALVVSVGYRKPKVSVPVAASLISVYLIMAATVGVIFAAQ
ncbi:MAG: hypothetical protein V3R22_02935 [Kiloniellales bacterium]